MIKKLIATVAFAFVAVAVFADNPPACGQNMYRLVSPTTLTSASVCGGAIQNIAPTTVTENPALAAYEQRSVLDLGGTVLLNGKDYADDKTGGAFQIGVLIPTSLFVYTADLQGVFVPFYNMHVGKTMTLHGSASKDITDAFSIGLGVRGGFLFDDGNDWTLAADIGAAYRIGDLAFMRNFRLGAVVKNLGKMFTDAEVVGMELKPSYADPYPAIATVKVGAACTFIENERINLASSFDVAFPTFVNGAIFDVGVMANINVADACVLGISSAWQMDIKEAVYAEKKNFVPSFGISAKFLINAKASDFMSSKGWEQSDVTVHTAWANLYEDTNAIGLQAIVNLGQNDTDAPEIILGN